MSGRASTDLRPVRLSDDGQTLLLIDQRELPGREVWLELRDVEAVARAIETLAVRGAPAIGCAAAFGLAMVAHALPEDPAAFRVAFDAASDRLRRTRPTAVNLFVGLERMRVAVESLAPGTPPEGRSAALRAAAQALADEDVAASIRMGDHGAPLIPAEGGVLTHCNTGALATAGYGTALGVIRRAWELGRRPHVFVDETRPLLQGARLTAWELERLSIPATLICDGAAGALMARKEIHAAIVGADRIARNGDVANKIGTYAVAVLCRHHDIPFYVAAPWTTVDLSISSGADITIEERDPDEVRRHGGRLLAPAGTAVRNPAFDVTPADLVTAIITERGAVSPRSLEES